ncbi:MAG: hypothetical protein VW715_04640 [Rhodospirillales bacterium]
MSNKRIDLTQFENMEDNRPWSTSWYPAEEEVEPDFLIEGGAEGHKVRIVSTQGGITLAYIANGNEVLANQIAKLPTLIAELKRCYEELDRPKVTIDDWDKEGPCVTVYLEGKEYVGILREYNASE